MYHLVQKAGFQGNPVVYQTFLGENLNRSLKRCLSLCHQRKIEVMGLCKLAEVLGRPTVRRQVY